MSMLDVDVLTAALRIAKEPCVSIFMPTHRRGADTLQDPIRLENLAKDASRQLEVLGHDGRVADRVLAPVRALAVDSTAWPLSTDGLAVLAWDGGHRTLHVPFTLPELCIVGRRLHTMPLIPMLADDARFAVLALSQKSVRWFEGTRCGLRPVNEDSLPASVADVVGTDVRQRIRQFRNAGSNGAEGRGRNDVYSGHGGGPDDTRPELEKFARAVDDAVCGIASSRHLPVVLAAAEPIASIYRRISKLPGLVPETVNGNFELDDGGSLFEKAWPVIEPRFEVARQSLAARIRLGLGTGLVVQRIEEVVRAARDGRIDEMFAASDAHRWAAAEVDAIPHAERSPGDVDLIDVAVTECLLHGGRVHTVPATSIPGDHAVVAAALRF